MWAIGNVRLAETPGEEGVDIVIDEEKISALEKAGTSLSPDIDGQGLLAFPGGIDPHVHMELPTPAGRSADDFESGSKAAIAGGTTTIIDFVTPNRGESLSEALKKRIEASGKSLCDVALHVGITGVHRDISREMEKCVALGATSFKTYLAYRQTIGIGYSDLERILEIAKSLGVLVTVHCEDGDTVEEARTRFAREGRTSPIHHALSRPPEVERIAVERVLEMARGIGGPVYIVHISTADALDAIRRARPTKPRCTPKHVPITFSSTKRGSKETKTAPWTS
ncbi:MAG: amidohydrolase family protein [Rhodopseudomonas palustris]|nr:amidohydrolase family protein [Rhodopseudomonas palustris]